MQKTRKFCAAEERVRGETMKGVIIEMRIIFLVIRIWELEANKTNVVDCMAYM